MPPLLPTLERRPRRAGPELAFSLGFWGSSCSVSTSAAPDFGMNCFMAGCWFGILSLS